MPNSVFTDDTTSNTVGQSIKLRGIEISTIPGSSHDACIKLGTIFEANLSGVFFANTRITANGSVGSYGQVLTSNGAGGTFWNTPSAGGPGGNTSQYLQVANAVVTYQTKAIERAALANTNIAIKDRLQVANAAAVYQTKAIERAALANTNIAIKDRLQVANAAAIYRTIAVENAHLANTNAYIKSQLANTNIAIKDRLQVANAAVIYQTKAIERAALANTNIAIKDRLQVANAAAIYTTKLNPTTSGVHAHTGRSTISTNLVVSGNTTSNKLIVTNRLVSQGNNVLGAAGKTQIVNGILAANGDITVSKNLTITGNTTMTGALHHTGTNSRTKLLVWNTVPYGFGMGSGYTFGPLNGFATTFQMDTTAARGWWWGRSNHANSQGAMGLSIDGHLTIARKIRVGYGESDTVDPASWNAGLDLSGNMRVSGNTNLGGNAFYSTLPLTTVANTVGLAHIIPEIQNGAYTLLLDDFDQMKRKTGGAAASYTISNTATTNYPLGYVWSARNISANTLTIARAPGVTLRKAGSSTNADIAMGQWSYVSFTHEAANIWVASGTY